METLLTRYRGLLVLVIVLSVQMVMLGVQVRNQSEMRLLRVWAISAVTPFATVLEGVRSGIGERVSSYVDLRGARSENNVLRKQLSEIRRQNEFLRAELNTADRAEALLEFRQRILSRTIAARIIGANAAPASRVVFIDRGASDGLVPGMAVLSARGVAGRVLDVYPATSQVMLLTDPSFAMGVVSQRGRVPGTLKGLGQRRVMVDYIENHMTVEKGEWFYSSGDDRVFPRGLPVGPVAEVSEGGGFQDVLVEPAGLADGLDEVLVVMEAAHQALPSVDVSKPSLMVPPRDVELDAIPDVSSATPESFPLTDEDSVPAGSREERAAGESSAVASQRDGPRPALKRPPATDADRLLERYRRIGESQSHTFGEGLPGSAPPDFNRLPAPAGLRPAAAGQGVSSTEPVVRPSSQTMQTRPEPSQATQPTLEPGSTQEAPED